jgi:hypothetical protein
LGPRELRLYSAPGSPNRDFGESRLLSAKRAVQQCVRDPDGEYFEDGPAVDVDPFDESHNNIGSWHGVRGVQIQPPPETVCYLLVSGPSPTRYVLQIALYVRKGALPPPLQVGDTVHLPKWWGDPPAIDVEEEMAQYLTQIDGDPAADSGLRFQGVGGRVAISLFTMEGALVREGTNQVHTSGLAAGNYIVRLGRMDNRKTPLAVYQVPPRD